MFFPDFPFANFFVYFVTDFSLVHFWTEFFWPIFLWLFFLGRFLWADPPPPTHPPPPPKYYWKIFRGKFWGSGTRRSPSTRICTGRSSPPPQRIPETQNSRNQNSGYPPPPWTDRNTENITFPSYSVCGR